MTDRSRPSLDPSDTAAVVEGFLTKAEIPFAPAGAGRWGAQLRGDHKHSIGFGIAMVGDLITFEAFFMRRPQENLDRFYELLLRRNLRSYGIHFALDADGDVYLVGQRAAAGLTEEELDRIVGAILIEADGMFNAAIEVGFASYLERDRAWRAHASE